MRALASVILLVGCNSNGSTASIVWTDGRPQRVSLDVLGPIRGHVSRVFVYYCPT